MGRTKTNEEFIKEVRELVGDEYVFKDKYIKNNVKIKCIHKPCGNLWDVIPSSFLRGARCPTCRRKSKKKTNEEFIKEVRELVGDEYTFLEEYEKNSVKIKCRHNTCEYEWDIKPNSFLMGNRCPRCSGKVPPTDREFKEELQQMFDGEYLNIEPFKDYSTPIEFRHEPCGYEYTIKPSRIVSQKRRCPNCFGMGRYTDENFRKKVRELVGADYSYIGEYKGSHDHLEFTHHICGRTYEVTPANFLKGRRCPSCYGNERHTDEYITAKVLEVTEGEYEFIEEYEGNKVPIKCRHNICGRSWKVTTDNFFNKSVRCPRCKTSKGEERISNILKEQAIYFEQQVKFEELRYINPLFIDFYLPEHKVAIEYDGRQHFEPIPAFGGEEEFREGKIRDRIKDDYFQEHPYIRLIRIPYTEYENIEEIIFRELKLGSN